MQRRGRTSTGRQRWHCVVCAKSTVQRNAAVKGGHRLNLFVRWLCGNATLGELARQQGVSGKTLQRWFWRFWEVVPASQIPQSLSEEPLVLDAVSIEPRRSMALVGKTPRYMTHWAFAERECFESWHTFCADLPVPAAVVCDGQRGMLAAIRTRWPSVPIQRCLIHIIRQAQTKLTRRPKTPAGQDLRHLVSLLPVIRTRRQKRRWVRRWRHWCHKYHRFLTERSCMDVTNRKRGWWYTHRKLRAVRSLIQNSLPDLFTFIRYPKVPKTSNHVEGGINSRLKELLHRHRGLSLAKKQVLTAWFLAKKLPQKPPRNVL